MIQTDCTDPMGDRSIKLQVRLSDRDLARFAKVAERYGLPAETWARQVLRSAAGLHSLYAGDLSRADPEQGDISSQIVYQATERELAAYDRAARKAGLKGRATWIRTMLREAARLG